MMGDSGPCPSVYWNPIYFIVRSPEYLQGHGEIELAALEGKLRRRLNFASTTTVSPRGSTLLPGVG